MRRLLLGAVLVTGCKYEELPRLSSNTTDAGADSRMADATPDAPPKCYVPTSLGQLTVGSAADPKMGPFIQTVPNQGGPNDGKTEFIMGFQFSSTGPANAIIAEVVKPAAGFAVNTAYAFTSDANPASPWVASSSVYGNYQMNGTVTNYLFARNGSITFTQFGETSGSLITGTITATSYREIDQSSYMDLTDGCTSSIDGMQFYLKLQ